MNAGGNRRILVIDDNHSIHNDFRKILNDVGSNNNSLALTEAELFGETPSISPQNGFIVDSAFQGQEGLSRVEEAVKSSKPYAMAFIDVRMPPGWDGIETTARIWQSYPDLQVVICTAYSDYSWDDVIARIGQSDRLLILKKPFDTIEVIQLANALCAKWELLQAVRLKMEDLENVVTKRASELRKSEEQFRLIAENVADLIAVVEPGGNHLYISPSFETMLGCKREELQGSAAFAKIHPDDKPQALTTLQNCYQSRTTQSCEYRFRHQNGSWRVLEARISPVSGLKGEIEQVILVARDTTERKQADLDRQLMEVQLRHAQKMESIGQLAAGIAHEINTPTQYIGDNTRFLKDAFADVSAVLESQASLLKAAKAGSVTGELVAQVESAAKAVDLDYLAGEIPSAIAQSLDGIERVAEIVRAMKEFSHPGTAEKSQLDLNHAIENTITVCRNEWKYVADLVSDFDPSLPLILCLPGEINQAVLNIVVNAAHAIADVVGDGSKGKGVITVSTRKDADWVEIRIRDTGTGIPVEAQGRIFDPFFTTKGLGKGTGQGLAIAHSVIVDKHAGSIRFETQQGKGTTFIIRLPISASASKRSVL